MNENASNTTNPSITNHQSTRPSIPAPAEDPLRTTEDQTPTLFAEPPTLHVPFTLHCGTGEDGRSTLPIQCSTPPAAPARIDTMPLPAHNRRRNGRVACLPKVQRDMVNHMLWNALPYRNIVAALDEEGYTVTERQISSWATGGYLEWSLIQEHALQNRLNQDHMLDFLRRDDAPELPEVGLQAAATRLSQVLLQKLARAEDPEAHLDNYSKLVDLMIRLNREIGVSQKQRDDYRRTLGPEYDPTLVKEEDQISAIHNERFYSNPPSHSSLSRPAVPPALPPIPTAAFMAAQAREERECAEIERRKQSNKIWKACLEATASRAKGIQNKPAPGENR